MSAIDFSMDISREPDPKGDRVRIVLSGKFLPYKTSEERGASAKRNSVPFRARARPRTRDPA